MHGKASCPCLDPCADVLNLAIYYRLIFSEGGAYNIGYDEKLRANRQFLTFVGSERRLTLHLMELVGWNLNYTGLVCIENVIQVL
jgi:hypothetical protein